MTILIVAIVLVLLGLWYSGVYYNCSYFKNERLKSFIIMKELLNRRCELLSSLAVSIRRSDLGDLCEMALAESNIEKRVDLESEISAIFKELDYDNNIVMSEAIYNVEGQLKNSAESFNIATDNYNIAVSNFLIKMTAKVADMNPGQNIYIC